MCAVKIIADVNHASMDYYCIQDNTLYVEYVDILSIIIFDHHLFFIFSLLPCTIKAIEVLINMSQMRKFYWKR
jgi:hypothetical protein